VAIVVVSVVVDVMSVAVLMVVVEVVSTAALKGNCPPLLAPEGDYHFFVLSI